MKFKMKRDFKQMYKQIVDWLIGITQDWPKVDYRMAEKRLYNKSWLLIICQKVKK